MDALYREIGASLPDLEQLISLVIRLLLSMILGGIVGWQREREGKAAGLRTHMLVALGATLFIVAAIEFGVEPDGVSRIIQGLVAGIGFLGAGVILKRQEAGEVEGLTTAAGLWLMAAVGVAVGLGRLGLAVVSTALAWVTLAWLNRIEAYVTPKRPSKARS